MRHRLVVRITVADVGERVTIRWRPPELDRPQPAGAGFPGAEVRRTRQTSRTQHVKPKVEMSHIGG